MIQIILLFKWLLALGNPGFFNFLPEDQIKDDTLQVIEKVYVHTDRNFYYSGEDIWFKAYLVDASYNQLTDHSNNLHIDLLSPNAKIIDSHVIRIENGLGNGDFTLSNDLPSGQYQLRAYTHYMRNFGDQLFFNKDISIINPLENNESSDSIEYLQNKIKISFFPEGGSLVDNTASIVAFKAIDAQGKGCDVSGDIYSSDGKFITSFRSVHQGMGSFVLRPVPGLVYTAIVKEVSGTQIKTELPRSFSTGVTQSVMRDESNNLILTFKTNLQTLPLIRDTDLMLNISVRNTPYKTIILPIKSLYSRITISSKDLPDGIVMLTLSTASQNFPLCERLVFVQNNDDINVQIETNKMTFKQRDSVSVKITLRGDSTNGEKGFLSLSAAKDISNINSSQFPPTISSWFLLESDVRGPIENPSYYFDSSNPNRLNELDLLLMTQGWRDFKWKYDGMNYIPERGFEISGRLRKQLFDRAIPGSSVTIGLIGKETTLLTRVITDSLGQFLLPGVDFTGDLIVFASAVNDQAELIGEILLDSLKYIKPETVLKFPYGKMSNENVVSIKNDMITINRINKIFKLTDTIELEEVKVISKKPEYTDPQFLKIKRDRLFYGTPDNEIIVTPPMENYSNALEMIRGRVPGVEIFGHGPEIQAVIRGRGSITGGTSPLFLLDGAVTTLQQILMIPVFFIDRIDIIKSSTSIFGVRGGNGVIAVITRVANRIPNVTNGFHSIRIKMSGYNEPRIFYSPHNSSKSTSANDPDLRTTLFWEPNIILDYNKSTTLNYFNADHSSTIRLTLEGITSSGIPVSTKAFYEVD